MAEPTEPITITITPPNGEPWITHWHATMSQALTIALPGTYAHQTAPTMQGPIQRKEKQSKGVTHA